MIHCPFCRGSLELVVSYPVPPAASAATWRCSRCAPRAEEAPPVAGPARLVASPPEPTRLHVFPLVLLASWIAFGLFVAWGMR